MNLHGFIYFQAISNSSVNSKNFITFLDTLFYKLAESNIVEAWLVLDNAKIRKTEDFQDKINESSHRLIFLSPYSLVLNRIETVFSKSTLSTKKYAVGTTK